MKSGLLILLLLFPFISAAQIVFDNIPIDNQLIGRNTSTNLGQVIISGEAYETIPVYDSIKIKLYRENSLQNIFSQELIYNSGIASFNFEIDILAELANYNFNIYTTKNSNQTLIQSINNIVAGDVFIIQGQSNAEAAMIEGSSELYKDDFIRVYASGTHFKDSLPEDNYWYIGQGDGYRTSRGNTGQWGLKFAKILIDSTDIPIAIFNGAHGGKDISFFQSPEDYQSSLVSNYSRLYYRLNKTGLKDYVRAVIWSQGEWDGSNYANTSINEYKTLFLNLKESWLHDFKNIEYTYIFQTKNGCGGFLHNIKEAQRQLAAENDEISIMSTSAITQFQDNCHFPFYNGYEVFSERIAPLVLRDLYDFQFNSDIAPPMILFANLINDNTLVVGTTSSKLSIKTVAEDFHISSSNNTEITNTQVNNEKIIFSLSNKPEENATISYFANEEGIGNYITNTMELELVCFYNFPIIETSNSNENNVYNPLVYPVPTHNTITIEQPNTIAHTDITIVDIWGKVLHRSQNNSSKFEIDLPSTCGLYTLILEDNFGNIFRKKVIKQ